MALKTNLNKNLRAQLLAYDRRAHYRACRVAKASTTANSLLSAFVWSGTKEGPDYWHEVHKGMCRSVLGYQNQ